ncbi:hypothetical protein HMPREF9554_00125 [Treponema phagedenis F0421]|nr:hypothetical protein HMPREF9554_00125 [Treponema phagedenis F0421]
MSKLTIGIRNRTGVRARSECDICYSCLQWLRVLKLQFYSFILML